MSQSEAQNALGRAEMSGNLRDSLQRAITYAYEQSHAHVTLEHLLLALADDREAAIILEASAVDVPALMTDVSDYLGRLEDRVAPGAPPEPALGKDVQHIIQSAGAAAQKSQRRAISSALVLAAVVGDGRSPAAQMLKNRGLTFEHAIAALKQANVTAARPAQQTPAQQRMAQPRPAQQQQPQQGADATNGAPGPSLHPSLATQPATQRPDPVGQQQDTPPTRTAPSTQALNGGARLQNMQAAHEIIAGARERIAAARGTIAARTDQAQAQPSQQPAEPVNQPPTQPATPQPPQHSVARAKPTANPPRPNIAQDDQTQVSPMQPPAPQPARQPVQVPRSQQARPTDETDPRPTSADLEPVAAKTPAQPPAEQPGRQTRPPAQVAASPAAAAQLPPRRPPPEIQPEPDPRRLPPQAATPGMPTHQAPQQPAPQAVRQTSAPPAPPQPAPKQRPPMQPQQHPSASPAPAQMHRTQPPPAGQPGPSPMMPVAQQQPIPQQVQHTAPQPSYDAQAYPPAPSYADPSSTASPIEPEQLVQDIPKRMCVGVPITVEIRAPRARLEAWSGGGSDPRNNQIITKAMVMRLKAPEGGFTIEITSPETQWSERSMDPLSDADVSWRWTVTPTRRGRRPLQLSASTRVVGSDGLAAARSLPDQVVSVRSSTNYLRFAGRAAIWLVIACTGIAAGYFGEGLFSMGSSMLAQVMK